MKNKKTLKHTIASLVLATTLASTTTGCNSKDDINKETIIVEDSETNNLDITEDEKILPEYLSDITASEYYKVEQLDAMLMDILPNEILNGQISAINQVETNLEGKSLYIEKDTFENIKLDGTFSSIDLVVGENSTYSNFNSSELMITDIGNTLCFEYASNLNEENGKWIIWHTDDDRSEEYINTEDNTGHKEILYKDGSREKEVYRIISNNKYSCYLKTDPNLTEETGMYKIGLSISGEEYEGIYATEHNLSKSEYNELITKMNIASDNGQIKEFFGENARQLMQVLEQSLGTSLEEEFPEYIDDLKKTYEDWQSFLNISSNEYESTKNKWYDESILLPSDNNYCKVTNLDSMLKAIYPEEVLNDTANQKLIIEIKKELEKIGDISFYIRKEDTTSNNISPTLLIINPNSYNSFMNSTIQFIPNEENKLSIHLKFSKEEIGWDLIERNWISRDNELEQSILKKDTYQNSEIIYLETMVDDGNKWGARQICFGQDLTTSPLNIALVVEENNISGLGDYHINYYYKNPETAEEIEKIIYLTKSEFTFLKDKIEECKDIGDFRPFVKESLSVYLEKNSSDEYDIISETLYKLIKQNIGKTKKRNGEY